MVADFDWNSVRFLESTTNIKRVLKKSIGREPSTGVARDATVCLQQGRMFYQAAERAPLGIRPLLIFYGMLNFSKALIVARNFVKLETLEQMHGLRDTSRQNDTLEKLKVKILADGIFQRFNDTICQMDRVCFYRAHMPDSITIPTSKSNLLSQKTISLKEVLARIPNLESLYQATFDEDAKTTSCMINYDVERFGYTELRIDDPEIFRDENTRVAIVDKWRRKFPFLDNLCLVHATRAWGKSIIVFANIDEAKIEDISSKVVQRKDGEYGMSLRGYPYEDKNYVSHNFWEILDPIAGGLRRSTHLIEAFEGVHMSELSLYYLGMYLLSSLVRYRPQIWARSISRLAMSELPADDKVLALVERFMASSFSVFPTTIVDAMKTKIREEQMNKRWG